MKTIVGNECNPTMQIFKMFWIVTPYLLFYVKRLPFPTLQTKIILPPRERAEPTGQNTNEYLLEEEAGAMHSARTASSWNFSRRRLLLLTIS